MADPILSVIIPAYNAGRFIGETIQSVLNQTIQEHEIIVVDDGSTDNTCEVLRTFDARVRVIRQENRGVSAARNRGTIEVKGEWVTFLDADDLWMRDFEAKMLSAARNLNTRADIIVCGWQYASEDGVPIGDPHSTLSSDITFERLLSGNLFCQHAAIIKKSCVAQLGGFNTNLVGMEDWDYWLRAARCGCVFWGIPDVLVLYRQVYSSSSRRVAVMRNHGLHVLDTYYAGMDLPRGLLESKSINYGKVKLWAGANYYGIGLHDEGLAQFVDSLIEHPELFGIFETYYTILCAEQPLEYKGTGTHLNLASAEQRLHQVIEKVFLARPYLVDRWQHRSSRLGYRALSRLAEDRGDYRIASAYRWRILRVNPSLFDLGRFARTWLTGAFAQMVR